MNNQNIRFRNHLFPSHQLNQGSTNYGPQAGSCHLPVFVYKDLLSHTIYLHFVYDFMHIAEPEVPSYNKDCTACKT